MRMAHATRQPRRVVFLACLCQTPLESARAACGRAGGADRSRPGGGKATVAEARWHSRRSGFVSRPCLFLSEVVLPGMPLPAPFPAYSTSHAQYWGDIHDLTPPSALHGAWSTAWVSCPMRARSHTRPPPCEHGRFTPSERPVNQRIP